MIKKNYMYVFVRQDLSRPQQAVQASHAAIESTHRWPYIGDHPHMVLIGVKNEEKLRNALDKAKSNGILVAEFKEDDVGLTAFATRPIVEDEERQLFKKYQLLK